MNMENNEYKAILQSFDAAMPTGKKFSFERRGYLFDHLDCIVCATVYHHREDFFQDAFVLGQACASDAKTSFVFVTRENGTWLFRMEYEEFASEDECSRLNSMYENYGNDFCAFSITIDPQNSVYKLERKI